MTKEFILECLQDNQVRAEIVSIFKEIEDSRGLSVVISQTMNPIQLKEFASDRVYKERRIQSEQLRLTDDND